MKDNRNDDIKEYLFTLVQHFLKSPPLVIWGSGATIPFGIPSMNDLNESLKEQIEDFDDSNNNLEEELGKDKYIDKMPEIKKVIWDQINEADTLVLKRIIKNDSNDFEGIKSLAKKFIEPHPQVVNIITTNYDRILEHIMSYQNINFTDGFEGRMLSKFNLDHFKDEKVVNLIKVHGSLDWFDINGEIRYLSNHQGDTPLKIIAPGKNKYEEAYASPYRELIQKADSLIEDAASFLVVGFGFNDEHLTPKIRAKMKQGIPVVLITKEITENSFKEMEGADKYILFEEAVDNKTKVFYKDSNSTEPQNVILEGDFWQLSKFMEIL